MDKVVKIIHPLKMVVSTFTALHTEMVVIEVEVPMVPLVIEHHPNLPGAWI